MSTMVSYQKAKVLRVFALHILIVLFMLTISLLITLYTQGMDGYPILVGLFCCIILPWCLILQIFLFHRSALIIDNTCVTLFTLFLPISFFIRWPEIQKISVKPYKYGQMIYIDLKDMPRYILPLPLLKRLILWIWTRKGDSFLFLPSHLLNKSATELLQEVSQEYAQEIDKYTIFITKNTLKTVKSNIFIIKCIE